MKGLMHVSLLALLIGSSQAESFEEYPAEGFERLSTESGTWTAEPGQVGIHAGHAKVGKQSLRLVGGAAQSVELELAQDMNKPGRLSLWAERWTSRGPFEFRIDAAADDGDFKELWSGDKIIKVGGFHARVELSIPAGTARLRFRCTAPAASGVMIDELLIEEDKPMKLLKVESTRPVVPVLVGKDLNPVVGLKVATEGALKPLELEAVEVVMDGTTYPSDVVEVSIVAGEADPSGGFGGIFGEAANGGRLSFSAKQELKSGDNWWWVSVRLKEGANIDGRVAAAVTRVKISGKVIDVDSPDGTQRIGVALRQHGDDGSKAYRIPGLARTKAGSLIAVYDVRYEHAGDLPANIDVGLNRSEDGGQSWEAMKIAIDMGEGRGDGVGDPCVFVDEVTGRIWIAALWSHGNRGWHGSGAGISPDETGQLVLVHRDGDGKT